MIMLDIEGFMCYTSIKRRISMGEAVWQVICPACEGSGQLATIKRYKQSAATSVKEPTPCEVCNGTGKIMIVKHLRKKGR
jgi:DnaJ-class molecular chaperone